MHKKFEKKIKGGRQSGRKVVPNDSKSDLPLDNYESRENGELKNLKTFFSHTQPPKTGNGSTVEAISGWMDPHLRKNVIDLSMLSIPLMPSKSHFFWSQLELVVSVSI